jgi:DNA-binding XRE family transcriptional regulator
MPTGRVRVRARLRRTGPGPAVTFDEWLEIVERRRGYGHAAYLLVMMTLEEDLVALRERRGLSQASLARRIGVSRHTVANLEGSPRKSMSIMTLLRHVRALGGRVRVEAIDDPRWENVVPIHDAGRRSRRGTQAVSPESS